jgi:hypothetical protein
LVKFSKIHLIGLIDLPYLLFTAAILLYNIILTDEGGPYGGGGAFEAGAFKGGGRKLMTKTNPRGFDKGLH